MSEYKYVFEDILVKLNAETRLRGKRTLDEWIAAERTCVLHEVNRQRAQRGHAPVVIADIERAERLATGHSDYIRKYAHAAADLVLRPKGWSP